MTIIAAISGLRKVKPTGREKQSSYFPLVIFILLIVFPPKNAFSYQFIEKYVGCINIGGVDTGIKDPEHQYINDHIYIGGTTHCCDRTGKFPTDQIVLQRSPISFPDGSPYSLALEAAAKRWSSVSDVDMTVVVASDSNISVLGNGKNDVLFKASVFIGDKINTTAFTTAHEFSFQTCHYTEADVYWNTNFNFTPFENANHIPYVTTTNPDPPFNITGVAVHEFGHVLGLEHESKVYNIMGLAYTHVNRNADDKGDHTYYGPGADGAAGARSLYGGTQAVFDLGVSIFAHTGQTIETGDQKPYSIHEVLAWQQGGINALLCTYTDKEPLLPIKVPCHFFGPTDGVPSHAVDANMEVDVSITLENIGTSAESGFLTFFIAENNKIDSSDRKVIRYHFTNLKGVVSRFFSVPIPADLTSNKNYYLGAIVSSDSKGPILEVTDANNAAWYPFKVSKGWGYGNSSPIAYSEVRNVIFEKSLAFTPKVSDPDGDPIIWSVSSNPVHGTVDLIHGSGHEFLYRPDLFYEGDDQFDYQVSDKYGAKSNLATIKLSIVRPKNSLVVNAFGAGGRVISNPGGIYCGALCTADFANNAIVDLTAIPDQGHVFDHWDTGCSGIGSCTVTMDTFRTVSAHFKVAPTSHTLTVDKTGTGSGSINSNPVGIACGEDCMKDYPVGANTQITLTAAPDAGSTFRGWNGACSGTGACTIRMYADQNITATFAIANPTIFTVTNLDDSGIGSMRQAILDANANPGDDFIFFQSGLSGAITLTSGQLAITDSLIIDGPGANVLAISGNNASRIFEIAPGSLERTVAINGLTLKEGKDISGNGGGGIYIDSGTMTINNCSLSNNSAIIDSGGGGGIRNYGWLTISNSTLSNNSAGPDANGGAIRNSLKLNVPGALTIINSTISGNSAQLGGGILIDGGVVTVSNGTVTGNSSSPDFGSGGGIFFNGVDGELRLSNSIVAGNRAANDQEIANGVFISRGNNLFGENGESGVAPGITLATNDLILAGAITTAIGPLADNGGQTQTHLPVGNGPANDSGDNNLILQGVTTDQRGSNFPRIMNSKVDIGAAERVVTKTLSVTKVGGVGTITSYPTGIDCGNTCTYTYTENSLITLTATPDSNSTFTSWGGDCAGTDTCQVNLAQNKNVIANFTTQNPVGNKFILTVDKSGAGSGLLTSKPAGILCGKKCSVGFKPGKNIKLSAKPSKQSVFSGWSGDCLGQQPCLLTMDQAHAVSAAFDLKSYPLSVSKQGNGSVTGNIPGIDCGSDCSESYSSGTQITLTATPDIGARFVRWKGSCKSKKSSCRVSMLNQRSVTAVFK